ncbi:MAG: XrtN system VIT domain-containing protein [Bacteroidia bacterium]
MRNSWRNSEEALFTFHLPEGSVITSLSLWIDGKEEKGYLTSKQKADSAYKTIVGVEQRDPSLVHWQEGNTVTVRVFPCTPNENRRFKLGITSPLKVTAKGFLVYANIYFDGPLMNNAQELRIVETGHVKNYDFTLVKYDRNADGNFEYEGDYDADWSLTIPAKPLEKTSLTFNGKKYTLSEYKQQLIPAQFNKIYLDINAEWSLEEIEEIISTVKDKPIYAWRGKWFVLNRENYEESYEDIYKDLSKLHFSMFPLYEIEDRKNSLLITKGTSTSPNLSDLQKSNFHAGITKLEEDSVPLKTYCLESRELSPYMKTLKEFRMIQCENGGMEELKAILTKNTFPKNQENKQTLHIQPAQILITESAANSEVKSKAPDHFFRLFAYNQIMKNAGAKAIHKDFLDTNLVNLAQQAYVVSPVSSLIVLETQADYERFGIEKSKNSLGNASMKSSGAVPEPHEWALIVMVLLSLGAFLFSERFRKAMIN